MSQLIEKISARLHGTRDPLKREGKVDTARLANLSPLKERTALQSLLAGIYLTDKQLLRDIRDIIGSRSTSLLEEEEAWQQGKHHTARSERNLAVATLFSEENAAYYGSRRKSFLYRKVKQPLSKLALATAINIDPADLSHRLPIMFGEKAGEVCSDDIARHDEYWRNRRLVERSYSIAASGEQEDPRTIYGALAIDQAWRQAGTPDYGDVALFLNRRVDARTSIHPTDSFTSITPTTGLMKRTDLDALTHLYIKGHGVSLGFIPLYIEAQIHGGLIPADIDKITIPATMSCIKRNQVTQSLAKYGLADRLEVIEKEPYEKMTRKYDRLARHNRRMFEV